MDPRSKQPRAESAPPNDATASSRTSDDTQLRPGRVAAENTYAFLAPPQSSNEMGWLGPYRVLAELGRGGMGVVFRAEDTQLKRQIALKVMLPQIVADERSKARFRREAEAQAKVEHEHVAIIHQVGEINGVPFIAMPLLKGRTLASALRSNSRPPLSEVIRIAREMAEGLAAAHEAGLVHRDIKPGNVWLEGSKLRVRILDFGLARAASTADDGENEPITSSGAIVGTPAYMSPEQAKGQLVDHRSDIFSLGIVLYQMATGVMPFTGSNAFATLVAVTEHHPPAPAAVVPEVPPLLSDFIQRLLAKDPNSRPQTAATVAAELEAIESSISMPRVQVIPLPSFIDLHTGIDPWAEIATSVEESDEATDEPPKKKQSRKPPPATRRLLWVWAALGLLVLLGTGLLAAKLFKAAEPKGVLIVETDELDWEIVVKQNGQIVRDRTRDREFVLPPGEYAVESADTRAGLKTHPPRVSLAKDARERVRLWIEKPRPPKPKESDLNPPTLPLDAANRKALEAVLALGGRLTLLVDGKDTPVPAGGKLPSGAFAVRDVVLDNVTGLDQSLEKLRTLPPIKRKLSLKNTGITDAEFGKLAAFPGVVSATYLDLSSCPITDVGFAHIKNFPNLTWLDVPLVKITSASLAHLRGMNLDSLNLHSCRVDDAGMEHLADMTSLTRLWLMYTKVGDAGFKKLSKLTNLTYLHPGGITDDAVETLLGFQKLTSLHFLGSRLTVTGFRRLIALPSLENLTLGDTQIEDSWLASFKDFPVLNTVNLSPNKERITDASLKQLEECSNLRVLSLKETKVTEVGVKALAEKLPLCKISWDGGTIEPKK